MLSLIDQMHIEMHFASSLRFDEDALALAPALHRVFTTHFRVVVAWPSAGFKVDQFRVPQSLVDAGVDPRPCCTQYLLLSRRLAVAAREPTAAVLALHGALVAAEQGEAAARARRMHTRPTAANCSAQPEAYTRPTAGNRRRGDAPRLNLDP